MSSTKCAWLGSTFANALCRRIARTQDTVEGAVDFNLGCRPVTELRLRYQQSGVMKRIARVRAEQNTNCELARDEYPAISDRRYPVQAPLVIKNAR